VSKTRQPDLPDDADEKWWYPEHTAAKHEILQRYLGAWLSILGRHKSHPQLVLIDGFAGRGKYMEGQPGSPAIMFERACAVADAGLVQKVWVRCAEPNTANFQQLQDVCNGLSHPRVMVRPKQERFEDLARSFIAYAKTQNPPPPTFIMVDPYGVKGVRLETLREVLRFDRVEVFLTFMVRDPSRHLEGNYDVALTELFGGTAWRQCIKDRDRSECLMRTFQEVVTKDAAEYVLPYKVHEDESKRVLYYLVHLTNNDRGMRVMKEKMIKKSGEMTFFPITLRPTDQLGLDVSEQPPFPSLQRYLAETYKGQTMRFVDLLNSDYPRGHSWVEGQYSKALQAMEKVAPPAVKVSRVKPLTSTGKPTRAITDVDTVYFPSPAAYESSN
jgi:three-Cys-motif partner protein